VSRRGWTEVRALALARIRQGAWAQGARIPDEADLVAEFGAARATVNRALRDLAQAGYLERRRKGGTRVAETPVRRATLDIPIIRQDIEGRGLAYGYQLLGDAVAPLPDGPAADLGLAPGTPWRGVRALHLAAGTPFVLEARLLDPARTDGVNFTTLSANEWLVRNVAYSRGSFAAEAAGLDAAAAAALALPPGTPALAITRTTRAEDGPITWVRLTYAPGYRLEAGV